MDDQRPDFHDLDPELRSAFERAFGQRVDLETAARHLWRIHRAAAGGDLLGRARSAASSKPAAASRGADLASEPDRSGAVRVAAAPNPPRVTVRPPALRRALVSALTSLLMLMSSGVAVAASSTSLPGDVLYPVKRTTESARLILSRGTAREALLHLELAERRFQEIRLLATPDPQTAAALVDDALGNLAAAEQARDVAVQAQARELRSEAERAAVGLAAPMPPADSGAPADERIARADVDDAGQRPRGAEAEAAAPSTSQTGTPVEEEPSATAQSPTEVTTVSERPLSERPLGELPTGPAGSGNGTEGARGRGLPEGTRRPDAGQGTRRPVLPDPGGSLTPTDPSDAADEEAVTTEPDASESGSGAPEEPTTAPTASEPGDDDTSTPSPSPGPRPTPPPSAAAEPRPSPGPSPQDSSPPVAPSPGSTAPGSSGEPTSESSTTPPPAAPAD